MLFLNVWTFVTESVLDGFVCHRDQAGVITERGPSVEEMPPWDPAVGHFLSDHGRGPTVGGSIPGVVALGSVRKQAEQARKEHPSMAYAWAPAS